MNAPVGPQIKKLEPPNRDIKKPATIAVINPCCGDTPEAIPNAIASGSATTATFTSVIFILKFLVDSIMICDL